ITAVRKRRSTDGRHGVTDDGVVYPRFGLHIGRHDLRVIMKISTEGVALPAAFGFHNIEGYTSKEIIEGGAETAAGASEVLWERKFGDDLVDSSDEDTSRHGAIAVSVFEREEVVILFGGIYLEVILQGVLWVDGPILLGPEDVFTLLSCHLGPWYENDGFFAVVA